MSDERARRNRWPALFSQSPRALFVLSAARRIQFVNSAWEALTKTSAADAHGRACLRRGPTEVVFQALAPPPEAKAGLAVTVRRTVPPHRTGPPWWDVTFLPLGNGGLLGAVELVAACVDEPKRSTPAAIGAARATLNSSFPFDLFTLDTPESEQFLARAGHAATAGVPVWIHGEAGVGKTTLARVLHANSPRRDRPFISLDCNGLQPYLIDGLLWGTGGLIAAHRTGTLHLKCPALLPRDLQVKLANSLTHADAPGVIVTAPHAAMAQSKSGALADECAAQLAVIELAVPPLRERLTMIPRLLSHWHVTATPEALTVLNRHTWPGNLRELRSAVIAHGGAVLTPEMLPRHLVENALIPPSVPAKPQPSLDEILTAVERNVIAAALAASAGNQTVAATKLGIPRARLIRRLEALGNKATGPPVT